MGEGYNNGPKMAELRKATWEKVIILQVAMRIWLWIGHILKKKDQSIEKQTVDRNPQGAGRGGPK